VAVSTCGVGGDGSDGGAGVVVGDGVAIVAVVGGCVTAVDIEIVLNAYSIFIRRPPFCVSELFRSQVHICFIACDNCACVIRDNCIWFRNRIGAENRGARFKFNSIAVYAFSAPIRFLNHTCNHSKAQLDKIDAAEKVRQRLIGPQGPYLGFKSSQPYFTLRMPLM